jgi:hypothetical protein
MLFIVSFQIITTTPFNDIFLKQIIKASELPSTDPIPAIFYKKDGFHTLFFNRSGFMIILSYKKYIDFGKIFYPSSYISRFSCLNTAFKYL